MLSPERFFKLLRKENIEFFSGVPDSMFKSFCAYVADNSAADHHIIAANEGNALSLGIGYHLATNRIPLIYMQNSGFGNILNPLLSLADPDVYSIPMLLMIGWRGEPNVPDEPQHKKQGRVTIKLLETLEIPYQILSADFTHEQAKVVVQEAINISETRNQPYVLLVRKNSFDSYESKEERQAKFPLLREQAIKLIVEELENEDIVVATTGVASRELFEYRESLGQGHEKDFLTVGGMGHANQVALGIAMQKPDRRVFCFDGDGAMLMHMGSLAVNGKSGCDNFKHIIINNGAHDSVGGQPTVGHNIDIKAIAQAVGYKNVFQGNTKSAIKKALGKIKKNDGMSFLEIRVKKGFRSDLGRPSTTPLENKKALMSFIQ
jgi:phosphonopyruvate decarboxylase